ncbi:MAG: DUF1418 family protein, partial [Chloroflexota bacterium]|nr:DUF1418 family protein [Chloroflexota bacterium]
ERDLGDQQMMWFVLGLVVGAGGWWLGSWTSARKLGVRWYEWLLAALAVAFALLAIQNYTAFLKEMEPNAANVMLVLLGIPALVLAALAVFSVWWRGRIAKHPVGKASAKSTA